MRVLKRVLMLLVLAGLVLPGITACGKRTDPDWPEDVIKRPSRIPSDRNIVNTYR